MIAVVLHHMCDTVSVGVPSTFILLWFQSQQGKGREMESKVKAGPPVLPLLVRGNFVPTLATDSLSVKFHVLT